MFYTDGMNLHSSLTGSNTDQNQSGANQNDHNSVKPPQTQTIVSQPKLAQPQSKPNPAPNNNPTPSPAPIPIQYPTPPGIELSERFPGMVKPLSEDLVYEWQAGSRPFTKHTKQYYLTMSIIVLLLCLILFFAGQILPILVVLSVAFLAYAFSAVPPQQMMYRITTYGIRLEEKLYPWEVMGRFWFEKKKKQKLLLIETAQFPNRLTLVLADLDQEKELSDVLSDVLLNQQPPLSWTEKAAKWLQKKFPLELET